MLKIPLQFQFSFKNKESNRKNLDSAQINEASDEIITLASLDDIGWVTNAIEPEQQRGPSENP